MALLHKSATNDRIIVHTTSTYKDSKIYSVDVCNSAAILTQYTQGFSLAFGLVYNVCVIVLYMAQNCACLHFIQVL